MSEDSVDGFNEAQDENNLDSLESNDVPEDSSPEDSSPED